MAITQYYVNPAINADSGTGTIGDPFGDLQYALNTITRDATNGDQVNIKAGTAEVLAAPLSFATYGAPTAAAPLVLRGYTAVANDGGVGVIDGDGGQIINGSTLSYIIGHSMTFTNTGANTMLRLGSGCMFTDCSFTNSTGRAVWVAGTSGPYMQRCYVAVTNNAGVTLGHSAVIDSCYLNGATVLFSSGIGTSVIINNIIVPSGNNYGLTVNAIINVNIKHNVILSSASAGAGIYTTTETGLMAVNNIIAGFSGAGGTGMTLGGRSRLVGYNAFYNNTTDVSLAGEIWDDQRANDVALAADPFVDAANGDFSLTDAAKLLLRSAGWPSSYLGASTDPHITIGAVQYGAAVASGGGGPVIGSRVIRGLGAL